jgi:pyruvate ferredoxin oxidoreductase delta subunit
VKPTLYPDKAPWTLQDYPETTAFQAGHLVTKNAGWRSSRPKVDLARCTGCLQCYLHCPDGVISRVEKGIMIDFDFCKGCGICARMCAVCAIEMEVESS